LFIYSIKLKVILVLHREHTAFPLKMTGHSFLCRKIITVYSENNMEHLGTLRQIAEFFSLRALWCREIMSVFWH
jgi:hypothetical protein